MGYHLAKQCRYASRGLETYVPRVKSSVLDLLAISVGSPVDQLQPAASEIGQKSGYVVPVIR